MTGATTLYDRIGHGYHQYRRPDARIAARIRSALGDAASLVNVGAGTGSYEPEDRAVIAVEPSQEMIAQRRPDAAPVLQGVAEHLPLGDNACDAAMAVLTLHHWTDLRAGLAEMRRVARDRVVLLTWDPDCDGFWLYDEYFPDLLELDRRLFPPTQLLADLLGGAEVAVVPVPHDCTDGFFGAYWRRPEAYLDAGARSAISSFARMDDAAARFERLRSDLADGTWERRHGHLRSLDELDTGYRLVSTARTD